MHKRILPILSAVFISLWLAAAAGASVAQGPAGSSFYNPAAVKLKGGAHGDPIWIRNGQSALSIDGAARVLNIVYKSQSLAGKTIPVSGTIWVPKGTAPRGGWPVVSWGHGTTGSADACAPSRIADINSGSYTSYVFPTFNQWLNAGYAIVMTDYEGLGTPGVHPYLIGHSEGRGMIDIVKAAHKAVPAIGSTWVASGHSQGGHASMFAAADAKSWGGGLTFKGVAAFAPANNLKTTVIFASGAIKTPNSISGLGALILRSITFADTKLKVTDIINPAALAIMPQLEQRCLGTNGLGAADSFGQFAPGNLLKSWNGSGWPNSKVKKALEDLNGPAMNSNVKVAGGPITIFQGSADGTVAAFTTQALFGQLKTLNGAANVAYHEYPGVDHGGIVAAAADRALNWFNVRFGK